MKESKTKQDTTKLLKEQNTKFVVTSWPFSA